MRGDAKSPRLAAAVSPAAAVTIKIKNPGELKSEKASQVMSRVIKKRFFGSKTPVAQNDKR